MAGYDGIELVEHGTDQRRGNLIGIQPLLCAADYCSGAAFHSRLQVYMRVAEKKGWLTTQSIVVWPEHIGTWLVSTDESTKVTSADSTRAAMMALIAHRPLPFFRELMRASEKDRLTAALFRSRSSHTARIFHSIFSELAREFQVTIVAGSAILAGANVRNGVLCAGDGPLENVSAVYRPDGRAEDRLVRKTVPTLDERPFVRAGSVQELPVFKTPAGRLGVLICADSWYPICYRQMRAGGAQMLAVPSCFTHDDLWDAPWKGFNGGEPPDDMDAEDIGCISEAQAWRKYALARRMRESEATHGMNVFLRGSLWDMGMGGRSLMVHDGGICGEAVDVAALLNLWL